LQHEHQMRELQMQRMIQEMSELREDLSSKENKMKQLRYENDRLFNECSNLKNIQSMMGVP
jgi:cell division protein FtsB